LSAEGLEKSAYPIPAESGADWREVARAEVTAEGKATPAKVQQKGDLDMRGIVKLTRVTCHRHEEVADGDYSTEAAVRVGRN